MSRNEKSIIFIYVQHLSEFLIFLKINKNWAFCVFLQLKDERNTFFMRLQQKSGEKVRFNNFATHFSICASLGIYTLWLTSASEWSINSNDLVQPKSDSCSLILVEVVGCSYFNFHQVNLFTNTYLEITPQNYTIQPRNC